MSAAQTDQVIDRLLDRELATLEFTSETTLNRGCAGLLATTGKRLRGQLVLAAARQGPKPDTSAVHRAVCAVELLHLASLAHDDVIDAGTIRRGVPTLAASAGARASSLSGGWIFARAVELICECGESALADFAYASVALCQGGMLELRDLHESRRSSASYFKAASMKTASSFALAARLGASLSGCTELEVECVEGFGRELGMAYQIWDDIMDLFADTEFSGKAALDDLRHGNFSLPVIYAIEDDRTLAKVLEAAANADEAEIDWTDIEARVERTKAASRAKDAADARVARAKTFVRDLSDPESLLELLERIRRLSLEWMR